VGKVLLAGPRGYCAGVERAVITVEKALDLYGPPVYVRKQIVHNIHVVADLEKRGAIFVDETDEVPPGSRLVFSAHGVSPAVHEQAEHRDLLTIDATCPLVTKVHNEARRFADSGYQILLIGHEGHEEVEGTAGEAPAAITIVENPEAADQVEVDPERPVAWLSQTTLSVDETMQTVERLRSRLPLLIDPPSDDICYATQNRQAAVKEIAPSCDVVIVVGSENSSNSVRLAEVAAEAGADVAYRIDGRQSVAGGMGQWCADRRPDLGRLGAGVARAGCPGGAGSHRLRRGGDRQHGRREPGVRTPAGTAPGSEGGRSRVTRVSGAG
jgi:4-hydroxy-3-methylbut-2-enyl diphosphate reductase